jgi:hypothetical protein
MGADLTKSLLVAQRYWPTPHGMGTDGHGSELSQAVRVAEGLSDSERSAKRVPLLPTPTAQKGGGSSRSGARMGETPTLQGMARKGLLWPTPRARQAGPDYAQLERNNTGLSLETAVNLSDDSTGGQLNPTWVEWLMGFPLGWTDLRHSVTQWFRKSPN